MGVKGRGAGRRNIDDSYRRWVNRKTSENRRKATPAEDAFFRAVRRRGGEYPTGMRFRRQVAFYVFGEMFIIDFFCHSRGLAVEIDGRYHDNPFQVRKDRRRDLLLLSLPEIKQVRRYTNDQILGEIEAVLADLRRPVPTIGRFRTRQNDRATKLESRALMRKLRREYRKERGLPRRGADPKVGYSP